MFGKIKFYHCNFNFNLKECKVKEITNANLVIIPNRNDAIIFNRKYQYYFKRSSLPQIPETTGIFYLTLQKDWKEVSENFGEIIKITKHFIDNLK